MGTVLTKQFHSMRLIAVLTFIAFSKTEANPRGTRPPAPSISDLVTPNAPNVYRSLTLEGFSEDLNEDIKGADLDVPGVMSKRSKRNVPRDPRDSELRLSKMYIPRL